MDSTTSRRKFLSNSAIIAGGLSLATPLANLHARHLNEQKASVCKNYGPLLPSKDLTTGLTLLKLPASFCYQSFGWTGDIMSDGTPTPARHDGMAVMMTKNQRNTQELVLIRNHENSINREGELPPIRGAASIYDDWSLPDAGITGFGGGTTALFYRRGHFTGSQATLGGTLANCAGGPTPWGTWLSCEEARIRGSLIGAKDHGYVFETPHPTSPASAKPIKEMGFMSHEAVAVDAKSGYVYLTEDNGPNSGIYRFRPNNTNAQLGALEQGGTLEMLKVVEQNNADLRAVDTGDHFSIEWVLVEEPDAESEALVSPIEGFPKIAGAGKSGPYLQGEAKGAAQFYRMEGCWYQGGIVYMTDTGSGPVNKGVVWALKPNYDDGYDQLYVLYASPSKQILDSPDNITVNRRGGILICEDNGGHVDSEGVNRGTRLIGVDPDGTSFEFAENIINLTAPIPKHEQIPLGDYRGKEFCGACFDPTGRYLFVNIQTPGVTLAITGPWQRGCL